MRSSYVLPAMTAAAVVIGLIVFAAVARFAAPETPSAAPGSAPGSAAASASDRPETAEAPAVPGAPAAPSPELAASRRVFRYKVSTLSGASGKPFLEGPPAILPKELSGFRFKSGILVDGAARRILWEKNSRVPVPVASLTKLLTIYTAFEELEKHPELDLRSLATVSLETASAAPVKMNFRPGEKVELHELFLCAMLKSANDAALLIAEYFGGGRPSVFIAKMNEKAREIGMTGSHFVNANGLPIYSRDKSSAPRMNISSAYDFALLIERLYEYPIILRYTSLPKAECRHGALNNGNRLLGKFPGVDGLKTGYTQAAGHCLAFSCMRDGRRLYGIVTGFQRRQDCFAFVEKLLEWGFRHNAR